MPQKVQISLQNIKVLRKDDQFKSMSPWAVVMFDGQKKITKISENGNQEPEFNESWQFQRNSDVKVTVSLYKKEYTYDALKQQKETDQLIGKGSINILSILKRAKKQPESIVVDLLFDYDSKVAGYAYLTLQFTPGTNLEEYRNSEQLKKLQKQYDSQLTISNIQLTLETAKPDASYFVKVRNPNSSINTTQQGSGKTLYFEGTYEVYFRNQKLVYFDIQEITRNPQLDIVIGDDLVGIGILDLNRKNPNEQKQSIAIKQRGKQIGTISCQIKYEIWKEESIQEELSQIKQSNEEIKEQIKCLEKKNKFWLSPERFQLDQQLKKRSILDRRTMLMKHRSVGQIVIGNESQMFVKPIEKHLIARPDIVIQTTTVKLPNLKTNNHVEVPTEFNKQYLRDVHGTGFSTVESSSTLQRSVPKFSIPESKRFFDPKEKAPGPGRYGTNGVANDIYLPKKFQKITAISEEKITKQNRKLRQTIDTGLKKVQTLK